MKIHAQAEECINMNLSNFLSEKLFSILFCVIYDQYLGVNNNSPALNAHCNIISTKLNSFYIFPLCC